MAALLNGTRGLPFCGNLDKSFLNLFLQLRLKEISCCYFYFQDSREEKLNACNMSLVHVRKYLLPDLSFGKHQTKPSTAYGTLLCYMQVKNAKKKAQTNFVRKEVSNYFKSLNSFYDKSSFINISLP